MTTSLFATELNILKPVANNDRQHSAWPKARQSKWVAEETDFCLQIRNWRKTNGVIRPHV